MYQWLSELVFYVTYKIGHLPALLFLLVIVLTTAFIVLPLILMRQVRLPMFGAFGIIVLGVSAAYFHFLARPEIFSYLLLSLLLYALATRRIMLEGELMPDGALLPAKQQEIGKQEAKQKIDWRFIFWLTLLMALWCNLHTGFIGGIAILLIYVLSTAFAQLLTGKKQVFDLTACLALLGVTLASLLNPYGIGLWLYIPSLFFAPFNAQIDELRPINLRDISFHPFLAILFLTLLMLWKSASYGRRKSDVRGFIAMTMVSVVLIVVPSIQAFLHLRLIPFAVLIFLAEFAVMFKRRERQKVITNEQLTEMAGWKSAADSAAAQSGLPVAQPSDAWIFDPRKTFWPPLIIAIALFGAAICVTRIVPPQLPQSNKAFGSPDKAVEFLSKNNSLGKVLNDAQFGDVMIWRSPANPKVFVDTRYDMYGEDLIHDYNTMRTLGPEWQRLLEHYQIKLIFFPNKSYLIKALSSNADWDTIYKDNTATIMKLNQTGRHDQHSDHGDNLSTDRRVNLEGRRSGGFTDDH